ncbi:hypothetical protein ACHAXS_008676 [Conticribra weissflogii]
MKKSCFFNRSTCGSPPEPLAIIISSSRYVISKYRKRCHVCGIGTFHPSSTDLKPSVSSS